MSLKSPFGWIPPAQLTGLVGDGHPKGDKRGGLGGILVTIHPVFGFLKIEFIGADRSLVITWHSNTKCVRNRINVG